MFSILYLVSFLRTDPITAIKILQHYKEPIYFSEPVRAVEVQIGMRIGSLLPDGCTGEIITGDKVITDFDLCEGQIRRFSFEGKSYLPVDDNDVVVIPERLKIDDLMYDSSIISIEQVRREAVLLALLYENDSTPDNGYTALGKPTKKVLWKKLSKKHPSLFMPKTNPRYFFEKQDILTLKQGTGKCR